MGSVLNYGLSFILKTILRKCFEKLVGINTLLERIFLCEAHREERLSVNSWTCRFANLIGGTIIVGLMISLFVSIAYALAIGFILLKPIVIANVPAAVIERATSIAQTAITRVPLGFFTAFILTVAIKMFKMKRAGKKIFSGDALSMAYSIWVVLHGYLSTASLSKATEFLLIGDENSFNHACLFAVFNFIFITVLLLLYPVIKARSKNKTK